MMERNHAPLLLVGVFLFASALSGCHLSSQAPDSSVPSISTTALHEALGNEQIDDVRALISDGADLDVKQDGLAPLHRAILQGRENVARLLIESGADTNSRDEDGRTPLHYAVWQNQMAVARDLLSHGADIHAEDNQGRTALSVAGFSESNQTDVAATPGMVVCIDTQTTVTLVPCRKAYDRTVVGIISGAGDIGTGMHLGKKDGGSGNEQPVALAGRVYCWTDASLVAVEPGDFLTTSNTLGHAMKATDFDRAQGAIIGKAMTGLAKGEKGLVLAFVSLQ